MNITIVNEKNRDYFLPLVKGMGMQDVSLSIGAIDEDRACGLLMGRQERDIFNITCLYVSKASRHKKAASGMYRLLSTICAQSGLTGISITLDDEDDSGLADFFEAMGFGRTEDKTELYRLRLSDVDDKLTGRRGGADEFKITELGSVLDKEFNQLRSERNRARNTEISRTIPYIHDREYYDPKFSYLLLRDRLPAGCILLSKTGEDYVLEYLYIDSREHNPMEVIGLIAASFAAMHAGVKQNDPYIYINAANSSVKGLMAKLTGARFEKYGNSVCLYRYLQ